MQATETGIKETKGWAKAIASPAQEFGPETLPLISGQIPALLQGSLYSNGPRRLARGGLQVGHWFDGDGGILAVHFVGGAATGLYRYVRTAGYIEEERAGKLLFGGYGMMPPGPIWNRFRRSLKNAANTSVIALPDKLLALWEGGQPHALDLESLETWGLDDLQGLTEGLPYSAHPKRDPKTGDIYNFGVSFGKTVLLNVYRSDRSGRIRKKNAIPLDGIPLIHDFVFAGQYLVFLIPPLRIELLSMLLKMKSFSDSMSWQSGMGTQILVVDSETLKPVSRGLTDPWFQWHFGNGFSDSDGSVVLDFVRYDDFQTNQYLKEVPTGRTETPAKGTLWQMRLEPQTGKEIEMTLLCDRPCDFPSVNPNSVGQPWRYTYLSVLSDEADLGRELLSDIAVLDRQTGNYQLAKLGRNRYGSEPIYAPHPDNPDRGWILTVVFDSNSCSSEVWIFDSDRLDSEPVCRLGLPEVVPMGFHGTWNPNMA
ncbi:MAG: hypothetical protein F6J93_21780 [Oscillatoria sp. SIO1A7]|nr:hypothetical protein [Oscillatoria sp. SIO1A7]